MWYSVINSIIHQRWSGKYYCLLPKYLYLTCTWLKKYLMYLRYSKYSEYLNLYLQIWKSTCTWLKYFEKYLTPTLMYIVTIFNPFGISLFKGNRVPLPWSFVTTPQLAMSQELQRQTCCMRSQSHERSWPPLLKRKFGNGWLNSKCCASSCKIFNSGFQIQFEGFKFQFHFQFHQFTFCSSIPIPELNWPQPCLCLYLQPPAAFAHDAIWNQIGASDVTLNILICFGLDW